MAVQVLIEPEADGATTSRNALPVVIFDGDDTLWQTEFLYDRAREAAGRVVTEAGLDAAEWERLQREIDISNVAIHGLSRKRFPLSCLEAYQQAARAEGEEPDPAVAARVHAAASQVFEWAAPTLPHARDAIELLRPLFRIALLTQGDPEVQVKRVQDSGLLELLDSLYVTWAKGESTLKEVLAELGAEPDRTWLVGNSIPSDVNPALSCGLRAVWLDAHVWEHERREAVEERHRMLAASDLLEAARGILASAT